MNKQLEKGILGIAQAYGPYTYWLENLFPGMNPDATWRALMVISALKDKAFVDQALTLLQSPDSRVRAWACDYLASIKHQPAAEKMIALTFDPSPRVRYQARKALSVLEPVNRAGIKAERRAIHAPTTVLISDDDDSCCQFVSLVLRRGDYITRAANSEKETLVLAKRIKPQVIITDNMKGKDCLSGLNMTWDLCRELELRETLLVMLTADQVEPIFLWQGGDYYFIKPTDGRLLRELDMLIA